MKMSILLKRMLFSFAIIGLSVHVQAAKVVIDDLEDLNGITNFGGQWFDYDDSEAGGLSTFEVTNKDAEGNPLPDTEPGETFMKLLNIELRKGTLPENVNPYVGIGFNMTATAGEAKDLSAYESVSYDYKGPAHMLILREKDKTDDECYRAYANEHISPWKTTTITWEEFVDKDGNPAEKINLTNITAFVWQIQEAEEGYVGSFSLDNITLTEKTQSAINEDLAEKIKLYEDSATNTIHIELTEGMDEITMVNSNGQTVWKAKRANTEVLINTKKYAPGVYFITVQQASNFQTFKVVVR